MKKYCELHHLFYSSHMCPICMRENSEQIAKRYNLSNIQNKDEHVEEEKVVKKEKPKPLTNEMLQNLVDKFSTNTKRKK